MRRKPSDLKDAFASLRTLAEQFAPGGDFQAAVAIAAWPRIAGESLSRHTAAVGLEQQRLIVAVRDRMWKRNLEELGGQLLARLNRELGTSSIRYIDFRVDNDAAPFHDHNAAAETDRYSDEKILKAISPDLFSASERISDEGLRKRFLRAAGTCLVRKREIGDG